MTAVKFLGCNFGSSAGIPAQKMGDGFQSKDQTARAVGELRSSVGFGRIWNPFGLFR